MSPLIESEGEGGGNAPTIISRYPLQQNAGSMQQQPLSLFERHLAAWVHGEVDAQSAQAMVAERPRFVHAVLVLANAAGENSGGGGGSNILKASYVRQLDDDNPDQNLTSPTFSPTFGEHMEEEEAAAGRHKLDEMGCFDGNRDVVARGPTMATATTMMGGSLSNGTGPCSPTSTVDESLADREVQDALATKQLRSPVGLEADNDEESIEVTDDDLIRQALAILTATRRMLDERLQILYPIDRIRPPIVSDLSIGAPITSASSCPQKRDYHYGPGNQARAVMRDATNTATTGTGEKKGIPLAASRPQPLESSAYHPRGASLLNRYHFPSGSRGRAESRGSGGSADRIN